MNKKIILSILMIGTIATMAGAGTWAAFSDTGTSSGNTITAGTLNMVLSDDDENALDNVVATWTSPAGFKPGDEFESALRFSNTGSIDSHHIWFYLEGLQHNDYNADGSNLMDAIIITDIHERFNSVTTSNQLALLTSQVGDGVAPLTLREFCGSQYYTFDDQSGVDDNVLGVGDLSDYDLSIKFKFADDAADKYQGDNCAFNLKCVATQNTPTEGMIKLHA